MRISGSSRFYQKDLLAVTVTLHALHPPIWVLACSQQLYGAAMEQHYSHRRWQWGGRLTRPDETLTGKDHDAAESPSPR